MDRDDLFKKFATMQIDLCALTLEEHQTPVKIFLMCQDDNGQLNRLVLWSVSRLSQSGLKLLLEGGLWSRLHVHRESK